MKSYKFELKLTIKQQQSIDMFVRKHSVGSIETLVAFQAGRIPGSRILHMGIMECENEKDKTWWIKLLDTYRNKFQKTENT